MPVRQKNYVYRKKRKGRNFSGVQRYGKKAKITLQVDREVPDPASSLSSDHTSSDAESDQGISASRLKMRPENAEDNSRKVSHGETNLQREGYRLVALKQLSATLSNAHVCEEGEKT